MKKIAIVTIDDNNNIGNRLQNFAVQEVLQSLLPSDTMIETLKNTNRIERRETIKRRAKKTLIKIKNYKRTKNFALFNKNISFTKRSYDASNNNCELKNKFDYFIVGSDQVWNPNYGWLNSIDLLSFAKPEQRIAFSASYGINDIPENRKKDVAKELEKFKAISVREERGKEITKALTRREDIEVLLDPTMLISDEAWSKLAKKPKELEQSKQFLLCYFLGGIPDEYRQEIEAFARKNNYQIVDILDKKSKFYACGPSEFLYLEKNASLICTDSFHASVFAILNKKPFIVFEREGKTNEKMTSRLDTLIKKFKLENRWYNPSKGILKSNLTVDYSDVDRILEKERQKSVNFLRKALDI
ncbi:polysaccharide pyruvyl transferase family protein [Candidatus Saccharibacteria bacterium]|nr:polysaccharide pyruvyl transferase family protein [Candidatus Saccharibacteria bacterium]